MRLFLGALFLAATTWSGEVNLSELHILLELSGALRADHGALVVHVLGLLALVVALLAHHTHEVKTLRAAGEASDKGSCGFVLTAAYLYACCVYHSEENCSIGPWGLSRRRALGDQSILQAG